MSVCVGAKCDLDFHKTEVCFCFLCQGGDNWRPQKKYWEFDLSLETLPKLHGGIILFKTIYIHSNTKKYFFKIFLKDATHSRNAIIYFTLFFSKLDLDC